VLSALGAQDGGLGVQETELGVRTGREANNAAAPAKVQVQTEFKSCNM